MPRTARHLDPEGTYHVIANGNARSRIFHDDGDRSYFLFLLRSEVQEGHFNLHHFALMDTHVHLILRSRSGHPLSASMKRVFQSFTLSHARRYAHRGHLWRDRFKSFQIDSDRYLLTCGIYVELNPVRAGMVRMPSESAWTSHSAYLSPAMPDFLTPSPAFLGLAETAKARRAAYTDLARMWMSHPIEKKDAKRFFKHRAQKGLSPFTQKGTVPF